jgi:hypothetical protein
VALASFMWPSLRKAAHATMASVAWQEIRVRRALQVVSHPQHEAKTDTGANAS